MNWIKTLHKSIRFKFSLFLCLFGIVAIMSIYGVMQNVVMQMEEGLIANRLGADIHYIEDLIGSGDWNVRSGSIYRGDTLIGDGTEENANFEPFLEHERKTGTFSYVFIKSGDEGLGYVEATRTQRGYYEIGRAHV